MGKILLCRNEKRMFGSGYLLECYLNNQMIYKLEDKEEKLLEIEDGTYDFYCKTKSEVLPSYNKKINVTNEIIRIDIKEGFIRPNLKVSAVTKEAINGLDVEKIDIKPYYYVKQPPVSKPKESFLSIVGRVVIGLFLFAFGISLFTRGNNAMRRQGSSSTDNYTYTVDSQGIDEYGFYKITGTVVNTTNSDIDGLQIEFKCYDVNGNSIDTAKTYTENLLAGETWSYEAIDSSDADRIDHCDFYQITPYTTIVEFK